MKQQLTKEQSQRLIELGLPTEKASASVVEEKQGNGCSWTYPVFTIGDLLEVLPKDLGVCGFDTLIMEVQEKCGKYTWRALYYDSAGASFGHAELIDALYELVVWCIKNKKL